MKKSDRLLVDREVSRWSIYEFTGTFEEVIDRLQKMQDKSKNKLFIKDIYGWEDTREYVVYYKEPETDAEYNKRIHQYDEVKEARLKAARALLREVGELK